MNVLRTIRSLGPIDAVNLLRDPLLRWIVALPMLVALAARVILPVLIGRLEEALRISLGGFYPVIAGYALLITAPVMCGMVIGFLMLDERDDRTLLALRVTPLPLSRYLAWRLTLPMLLSAVVTIVAFLLAGLERPGISHVLLSALAAAPLAPLMALSLATFAGNKVQGFALVKVSSVFQMAPLLAYFIHSDWQAAFGIIPTYWPAKSLWNFQRDEPTAWFYFTVGLTYQTLLLALLLRRFNRAVAS
jgi:fluoroquinolone transport system permease protein